MLILLWSSNLLRIFLFEVVLEVLVFSALFQLITHSLLSLFFFFKFRWIVKFACVHLYSSSSYKHHVPFRMEGY